jgi:hypothetical protein
VRHLPALLLAGLLAGPPLARGDVYTWVDENGVTHLSDDPGTLPEASRGEVHEGRAELRGLWQEDLRGDAVAPPAAGGVEAQRVDRLIRGAVEDLERGETARATASLESASRLDPLRPEPHWYLALLARERGRYDEAEAQLRAFLAAAGDEHAAWRAAAQRKLAALEDERRLADETQLGRDQWVAVEHPHFRVRFDAQLGRADGDYANQVLSYLEDAHAEVGRRLGATPSEPLGVRFYGKAAYLRANRQRFSFQTVGFFDGEIHVVSAAHPAGELRALLFHEYTHAVYRERTGGDRPFWLNEGLAVLSERAARLQTGFARSELSSLHQRIDAGIWIPLRRLAPSFSGLGDEDARAAYLESTAAAWWLEQRTTSAQRARLLERLGQGASDDEALHDLVGLDTDGVDAGLRQWIRAGFAPPPTPAAGL